MKKEVRFSLFEDQKEEMREIRKLEKMGKKYHKKKRS